MTTRDPRSVVLLAVSLEDGAIVLRTGAGREFVATRPADLWSDVMQLIDEGGSRSLPGGVTEPEADAEARPREKVEAQIIEDPEAWRRHEEQEDAFRAMASQAADVAEEAAAQEWGMVGRFCAEQVRSVAPTIGRQLAHTLSGRRRRRRS